MNIIFVMKFFQIGGIEIVSQVMANKFYNEGHNVSIISFELPNTLIKEKLDDNINVIKLDLPVFSKRNVDIFRNLLVEKETDFIINQWGLPYDLALLCSKAKRKTKAKLISVYHNNPRENARIKDVEMLILQSSNFLIKGFLCFKKFVHTQITSRSMRFVYWKSDAYVLLSDSFIPIFKEFVSLKETNKLYVITNPVTVNNKDFKYDQDLKLKELIYVGRIDYNQKRLDRVIETWSLVEGKYPEWRLTIVGDGVARRNIEELVSKRQLRNVNFEGFKSPVEYYKRASVLILTSEYEGFGLVIVEGMSFGVVPVVYGSYPAVYDIIDSGQNGFIVLPSQNSFNVDAMAFDLNKLMEDSNKLHYMAKEAIKSSDLFSVDTIYSSWIKLFNDLIKNDLIKNVEYQS